MAEHVHADRDLRLGLYALESGAIDQEQLVSAVRDWAVLANRPLSEILADRGVLDADTLSRLDERVTSDLHPPASSPDPSETVAYVGRSLERQADAAGRVTSVGDVYGIGGWRFQVIRPHARGGLGEVFLAFDSELNRTVALKELQARRAHDPDSQARFLLEAEITGRLEHPGIVPVYSLGRHADGRPYYAMRLIEGETLREAIERFHRMGTGANGRNDRELAFRRLLRCVIDTCNAVAYAHSRGVVHRDLKPENIMLGRFGETLVVDWGVAKSLSGPPDGANLDPAKPQQPSSDASMTQPGSVIGTPRYMSPEQAAGDLDRVGPASDIYSLGAILYCLLVGHAPFPDGEVTSVLERARRGIFPAPRRLRRSIDPTLEAICLKAMELDPQARHASPLDLANDLEAWQADVRYRGEQELALSQVKGSMTRLCLERANSCFGREAHDEGMLWLARALENAPPEPSELARTIRTSLSGWHARARSCERSLRHGGEVHALAFGPEGRRLATACADGTARLWDISTGSHLSPPLRHEGPVRTVAFSPNGKSIATAGVDGLIWRWDAVSGAPTGAPLRTGGPVSTLSFSPDGSRIATAGGPLGSFLWDTATGLPVRELDGPAAGILAVAFSPDGVTVAVACDDHVIRFLDTESGRQLGEPLDQRSAITALVFDPDGRMLLTGCLDGNARLWDVARRSTALTLSDQGVVHRAAFRPDGDAFATASEDGSARLWDSTSGRPIGEPLAHRVRIDQLAFHPDGTMVATGSSDGTIRLWCASTGLPIGPPLSQSGSVRTLVFSLDGRRFATGGSDAMARCWKAPIPVEGTVERVSCWVSVTTNLEFDPGDAIRTMDGPTSWDLRRRLTDLGGPPRR
jgi:WD40 repeat protein/serine/threonine protein kinase